MPAVPPIAPRLPVVGNSAGFMLDPLRFLREMREKHGDVVRVSLGPLAVTLVSHPDIVEDILVTRNRLFQKDRYMDVLRPVLGQGLLSSEGDFWRRQRRLAQPAFHRERIAGYGDIMVAHASRLALRWRHGETRDVHKDMMHLTLDVVAEALFGTTIGDRAEEVGEAMEAVISVVSDPLELFFPVLKRLPTPGRRAFDRAVAKLDAIIYGIIEQRRKSGAAETNDLLSMLLHARDEDGSRMSDVQLRDEFLPERWEGDLAKTLHRYAYFPFGGGPRLCIGQAFAQMKAVLLLATLARAFEVEVLPRPRPTPEPSVTLRPKRGLRVRLARR